MRTGTYINNIGEAERYVRRILLGKGYNIIKTQPANYVKKYNKFTHCFIGAEKDGERKVFYVLYKRKLFMSFSRQFNLDGTFGESLNLDAFMRMENTNRLESILFVYPEGMIYEISPTEWRKFVEENNTIRMQYGGEVTTSVKVDLLNRWDREWTCELLTKWVEKGGISERFRKCLENAVKRLRGVLGGEKQKNQETVQ